MTRRPFPLVIPPALADRCRAVGLIEGQDFVVSQPLPLDDPCLHQVSLVLHHVGPDGVDYGPTGAHECLHCRAIFWPEGGS